MNFGGKTLGRSTIWCTCEARWQHSSCGRRTRNFSPSARAFMATLRVYTSHRVTGLCYNKAVRVSSRGRSLDWLKLQLHTRKKRGKTLATTARVQLIQEQFVVPLSSGGKFTLPWKVGLVCCDERDPNSGWRAGHLPEGGDDENQFFFAFFIPGNLIAIIQGLVVIIKRSIKENGH